MSKVITVSRELGSGGREVGLRLAKKLGIPFYDKELITMSAEKSGMSHQALSDADEKAANSLLYTLAVGSSMIHSSMPQNVPINDKLFLIQCEVIHELADKGPCIIVGRSGDYVLSSYKNCVQTIKERFECINSGKRKKSYKDIAFQNQVNELHGKRIILRFPSNPSSDFFAYIPSYFQTYLINCK